MDESSMTQKLLAEVIGTAFLVFVGVAQLFAKVPALHAMAPTQAEPPFAIAQSVALIVFVALGILAVNRFWPEPT